MFVVGKIIGNFGAVCNGSVKSNVGKIDKIDKICNFGAIAIWATARSRVTLVKLVKLIIRPSKIDY